MFQKSVTPLQNLTLLDPLEKSFCNGVTPLLPTHKCGGFQRGTPLQNRTVLDSEFPKVGFCNGGKGGSNGVNESIFDKSTKSIS